MKDLKLPPSFRADLLHLEDQVQKLSPHQLRELRKGLVHLLTLVQQRQEGN